MGGLRRRHAGHVSHLRHRHDDVSAVCRSFFPARGRRKKFCTPPRIGRVSHLPHYLMLAGVVLTALYMTRQMHLRFFRQPARRFRARARKSDGHDAPADRARGLLDSFSVVVLTPAWPWLHELSHRRTRPTFDFALLIQPMLFVSLALVAAGIGLGWFVYRKADENRSARASAARRCFAFSKTNCGWMNFTIEPSSRSRRMAARFADWMDRYFWDGLVRLVGGLGQFFGILTKGFDEHGINAGVDELTNRSARSRTLHVRAALRTNPNLSRRHRGRHAGAAASLRMAHLITALILVPLLGALFVSVGAAEMPRAASRLASMLLTAIIALVLVAKLRYRGRPACNSSNATPGFHPSAPNISSASTG